MDKNEDLRLEKLWDELSDVIFQKKLHFICSEELRPKYLSVGCMEHGEDDVTGLYRMTYN